MKITIIGCGTMGGALAKRLPSNHTLFLYDRNPVKMNALQVEGYGKVPSSLEEAYKQSDVVFLAVKPQSLDDVQVFKAPPEQKLISLLAGIPISQIKEHFPHKKVIRMMPNLTMKCGKAPIGMATDMPLTDNERQDLLDICEPLGKVYWLSEDMINAFASLAGSGPAFFYVLLEAMVDAAVMMGFNSQEAQNIVCHMIKGSIDLLEESEEHPGALKWQIASPGGTTIVGLKTLEDLGVRKGMINTVLATYDRTNELSIK